MVIIILRDKSSETTILDTKISVRYRCFQIKLSLSNYPKYYIFFFFLKGQYHNHCVYVKNYPTIETYQPMFPLSKQNGIST